MELELKIPCTDMDWREVCDLDERLWSPLEVKTDAETRVRVYAGQLMDTVLKDVTATNYLFQAGVYFKLGYRLIAKFPNREKDITDATMIFWQKLQTKLKEMRK